MNDFLIVAFGATAFASAILVVVPRQPMRAALALIAHMASLAAIFACLGMDVNALFQVLIYVGAVMLSMVYAIMLLDDQDASYVHRFSRWLVPGVVLVAAMVAAAGVLLAGADPAAVLSEDPTAPLFTFSSFCVTFMLRYWIHFELATVLLLVAIVAMWTVISESR